MAEQGNTREQLLEQLEVMRKRVVELEASEASLRSKAEKRNRAEEALGRSEASLAEAQRITRIGSWELDLVSGELHWSDEIFRIFELDQEHFGASYEAFLNAIHPDDRELVDTAYTGSLKSKTPYDIVHRLLLGDGRLKHVHERCETTYDDTGKPLRSIGTVQDITERKRAEEALRESERRYQSLSDATFEAIFLSERGICTDQNRVAAKMFGYSREEATGQPGTDWIAPEHRDTVRRHMMAGHSLPYEVLALRKDGSTFPCEIQASMTEIDGHSIRTTALRDITDRKRAEEERRKLEAQIQQTQKLESLGIMAGGIAHDFNNILTGLLGNAELALRDLPSHSPVRPLLHHIQKTGRRAADLTRQMLAYSGRGAFVVEDIDVNALVQDMSSLLESSTSKKAGLSYELSADLPGVRADATQLRQIVLNLVMNASEAVGGKGGPVRVSTYTTNCDRTCLDAASPDGEVADGRYVTIEVNDTGCGMDDETKAKVFEPFFTTKFTGRGLGLAAVQGIVRGHKGAILMESELGKGTTFKVLLPALDHPAEPVDRRAEAEDDWAGTGTILLVDDEEMVRSIAVQMLKLFAFSVLTASDGVEAVEMFRERHDEIACVLLDLTMPRMDGEEAFEELRKISDDVPVILSSGYSEQDATEQFGDKGLAGFLQKPYEVASLKSKLRKALGNGE